MQGEDEHIERRTAYLAGVAADRGSAEARAAFAQLVRLWHSVWLRFARSRVPDLAEDVLQDAVLTMARNIHRLRNPATFKTWSMTILHRRSVDAVRSAVRRREAESAMEIHAPMTDTDRMLDLGAAVASLSLEDRRLIRLHYTDGHTIAALSERLGVPSGTIKSRLHAARAKLKTHLKGDDDDEL